MKFSYFRSPDPHSKSVVLSVLCLFVFFSATLDSKGVIFEDLGDSIRSFFLII